MDNIIFEDPSKRPASRPRTTGRVLPSHEGRTRNMKVSHDGGLADPNPSRLLSTLRVPENTLSSAETENQAALLHRSHNGVVERLGGEGPASLLDLFSIDSDDDVHSTDGTDSASVDDVFSHQSEGRSPDSVTSVTSEEPSPQCTMDSAVEDKGAPSREVTGQSPRQTGSGGRNLGRSHHLLASSDSVVSGSEDLGPGIEDSESASDLDDDDQESNGRWKYRRIADRRIDSSGRRWAKVEWEDTWEPEDELEGLDTALQQYRQDRRGEQNPVKRGRKRKCPS